MVAQTNKIELLMVGIYILINSIFENKNNKEPKNKNISSICQQNVGRVPF